MIKVLTKKAINAMHYFLEDCERNHSICHKTQRFLDKYTTVSELTKRIIFGNVAHHLHLPLLGFRLRTAAKERKNCLT